MMPKMRLAIIALATLSLLSIVSNARAEDPMLKGLSWYGLDASPTSFRLNLEQFKIMKKQFPNMNFLCLPFSADEFTESKLTLLKQIVQFCGNNGIKVLITNYYQSRDWSVHTDYWLRMAQEFKGNSIVAGFDLLNEPWAFDYGDTDLPRVYEEMIDAIRAIDPKRTCYVQSYLQHWQGYAWIRTNPVNRQNIVYTTHIYSHKNKNTNYPSWDTTYAWVKYYINRQYSQGKTVLYNELYKRFIFAIEELGVRFAVPELATIDTAEGLQYFKDLVDILAENNVDWAYHQYYTDQDRPTSLTYPDGTLRPKASTVNALMARAPDINGDDVVDIFDIVIAATSFGSVPGDPNWDPRADIISGGIVDIFDVVIIATAVGSTR